MLIFGKYYSKDIYEWEGGFCFFYFLIKCFCKNCDCDENGFYLDMKC